MQNPARQAPHDATPATLPPSDVLCAAPNRRTFLLGGTAAGLVAATLPNSASQAQATEQNRSGNPIPAAAVGYWDAQSETVKPAAQLLWGARRLTENGARVTVHGLGSGHPDPMIAAFSLYAHFPTRQAGVSVPFHAWNYRSDQLNHRSSPVSFSMPVSRAEGLTLSVVYPKKGTPENGAESVRTEHFCRLSLGAWSREPKLRQGVYFIALPDSHSNTLPDWDACRFVPEYAEDLLTGGTLWAGLNPAPFHYLILSVDPAMASGTAVA